MDLEGGGCNYPLSLQGTFRRNNGIYFILLKT